MLRDRLLALDAEIVNDLQTPKVLACLEEWSRRPEDLSPAEWEVLTRANTFTGLRARHCFPRSSRYLLGGWTITFVIWPYFGLTRIVGRTVEPVGVAVHVAGVQVPVQVKGRGDARVPHDLLQHLRRIPGLELATRRCAADRESGTGR